MLVTACSYAIFVLHSAVARDLAIAGFAPHLILAGLIVVIVLRVGHAQGVLLAAIWGILADCLKPKAASVPTSFASRLLRLILQPHGRIIRRIKSPWEPREHIAPLIGSRAADGASAAAAGRWSHPSISWPLPSIRPDLLCTRASLSQERPLLLQLIVSGSTGRPAPASPSVSNRWRMLTE